MRGDPPSGHDPPSVFFNHPTDISACHGAFAAIEEERGGRLAGHRGPSVAKVGTHGGRGELRQRDLALLVALPPNEGALPREVDPVEREPAHLPDPETGAVQELEHRTVAEGDGLGEGVVRSSRRWARLRTRGFD